MKKYKQGCGCKENKCVEEKLCGCIIELSTDCVRWEEKEDFSQGERLTDILVELKEEIQLIKDSVDLIPKTVIQEFFINEEVLFNTKYNFIPSSVEVLVDGIETTNFTTRLFDEVLIGNDVVGEVLTIKYKTVEDV